MNTNQKILKYPNKILTTPTDEWNFGYNDKQYLLHIIEDMKTLLKTKPEGVALAANQAGYNFRLFINENKFADKYSLPHVIINPTISAIDANLVQDNEGCLSFPGLFLSIKRNKNISCDFYDVDGNKHIITLEDFPARVFQHECEHLDGKLYINNFPIRERYQIIGKFKNRNY